MDDQFVAFPQELENVLQFGAAFAGRAGAGLGAYDLAPGLAEPGLLDLEVLGRRVDPGVTDSGHGRCHIGVVRP